MILPNKQLLRRYVEEGNRPSYPGGEQEVTVIRRQASPETENNQPLLPYLAIDGLVNKGLIVISKSLEPFLSEGRARAGVSSSMHAR